MSAFSFIHCVERTSHITHLRKSPWIKLLPFVTYYVMFFLLFYLDSFVPKQTSWKLVSVSSYSLEDPKLKRILKMKQELLREQKAKNPQK